MNIGDNNLNVNDKVPPIEEQLSTHRIYNIEKIDRINTDGRDFDGECFVGARGPLKSSPERIERFSFPNSEVFDKKAIGSGNIGESFRPFTSGAGRNYAFTQLENGLIVGEQRFENQTAVLQFSPASKQLYVSKTNPLNKNELLELKMPDDFMLFATAVNTLIAYTAPDGVMGKEMQKAYNTVADYLDAPNPEKFLQDLKDRELARLQKEKPGDTQAINNLQDKDLDKIRKEFIFKDYHLALCRVYNTEHRKGPDEEVSFINLKDVRTIAASSKIQDGDLLKSDVESIGIWGEKDFEYFKDSAPKNQPAQELDLNKTNDLINAFAVNEVSPEERELIARSGWCITEKFKHLLNNVSIAVCENRIRREEEPNALIPTPTGVWVGPSGCGKSETAKYMAKFLGLEFRTLMCQPTTGYEDLIASHELINNGMNTTFQYTAITETLMHGGVCLIDEVDKLGNPGVLVTLNNALSDGEIEVPIEGGGAKKIQVHPDAIIIFAGNLGHRGSKPTPASINDRAANEALKYYFPRPKPTEMQEWLSVSPYYKICLQRAIQRDNLSEGDVKTIQETIKNFTIELDSWEESDRIAYRLYESLVLNALRFMPDYPTFGEAFQAARDYLQIDNPDLRRA